MYLLRGSNEKYTIPSIKCSCQKTSLIQRSIHRTYGAEKLSNNTRGMQSAKSRIWRMIDDKWSGFFNKEITTIRGREEEESKD